MEYFTQEQRTELNELIERDDLSAKIFKRVQIVHWRASGKSTAEIVELSRYSRSGVQKLCASYRKAGVSVFYPSYGGNYRKLSYEEEAKTLAMIMGDATVGKYVRAEELKQQFEKITGISYNIYSFYRLLKRHKWRKLKPRGRHPKKASEEAIEASKKLTP